MAHLNFEQNNAQPALLQKDISVSTKIFGGFCNLPWLLRNLKNVQNELFGTFHW